MLEQRLTWQEIETSTDIEHLKQVLRIYSKAANTRLRALEKAGLAGNSNAYQTVRNYAYDEMNIMAWTASGKFKFNTNTRGMEIEQIRRELKELDKFLFRSHTSTVTGAKTSAKKIREATIAQNKRGTKSKRVQDFFGGMSDTQFNDFWKLANIKRLFDMYGSDEAIRIIEHGLDKLAIDGDFELLDMALADILNDDMKSVQQIYDDLDDWKPTGSVT